MIVCLSTFQMEMNFFVKIAQNDQLDCKSTTVGQNDLFAGHENFELDLKKVCLAMFCDVSICVSPVAFKYLKLFLTKSN